MWLIILSDQLPDRCLGEPLPHQLANRTRALLSAISFHSMPVSSICGISSRFRTLSPVRGQIPHVLLTRPPRTSSEASFSFDLHVLSTPPAFILSQDQTLRCRSIPFGFHLRLTCFTHFTALAYCLQLSHPSSDRRIHKSANLEFLPRLTFQDLRSGRCSTLRTPTTKRFVKTFKL